MLNAFLLTLPIGCLPLSKFCQMRKLFLLFTIVFALTANAQDYTQYVNPFIGTGFHGHTFPGATVPHGMVQLSPDTRLEGWDGCSGYHYDDDYIYGFSHTHLSGTGIPDYCDVLVAPMSGAPSPDNKIYGSKFSHSGEKASPGYYAVRLLDDGIDVELTATERVGLHKYIFSASENNSVILDLKHRDEVLESSLKIEDSFTVSGLRRSQSWAKNQYVFFVIRFNKPLKEFGIWQNDKLAIGNEFSNSKNLKAYFKFDLRGDKSLLVKVAISGVNVEGAKKNMEAEMPGWDFAAVRSAANTKWNTELGKIEVSKENPVNVVNFYTALYHTGIQPNINMDVDGQYRGLDNNIHKAEGFTNYTVFSLWDTYRAAHPLYTIIDRKRTLDYIKTFLAQYKQGGRLPVWELASNETDCMIGYHSIPVIVDAYQKGIGAFDVKLALEAMKKSATWNHLGLPAYIATGMISMEDEHESVSKTLEYAYDDWCIAQFAKLTGNNDDYKEYIKRAQYYKNMLEPSQGFMRARKNGDWFSPFEPREVNSNYTEANSWQYSLYFPHDVAGYLRHLSKERNYLEAKLDSLFSASIKTTGREQSDITGLIGQYAHGNEPSHQIIYMYNYAGKPHKTQELLNKVTTEFYKNAPDGLIGNEDCGQMSAWYILSAMGFYPVAPGTGIYEIGKPLFKSVSIKLENNEVFKINAQNLSEKNIYVQSVKCLSPEGRTTYFFDRLQLTHEQLNSSNELSFVMADKPNMELGKNYSPTAIDESEDIAVNPVIKGGDVSFKDSRLVTLTSTQKNASIYYTTDGSVPGEKSTRYSSPIKIVKSTTLKAIAVLPNGKKSFITTAKYVKVPHNWSVKLNTPFEKHYSAGGADALVDGIIGEADWRKGNWQGYQNQSLDAIIDLKKRTSVGKVSLALMQDTRAWIVCPKAIVIEASDDGKVFKEVKVYSTTLPIEDLNPQVTMVQVGLQNVSARYLRVKALQYGKLPQWHEGAGGDTHIFVSEIIIE